MKRYFFVYIQIVKLNFARFISNRVNFFGSLVSSIGWGSIGIIGMFLLTAKTQGVFGWSRNDLLLLAGCYPIFSGIFYLFFSKGIGLIPQVVNKGELDSVLVKPLSSQFYLSCYQIDFIQIFRIVTSFIFVLYLVHIEKITMSLPSIIFSLGLFIFGIALLYSIWFAVVTISLWHSTLENLKELLSFANTAVRYPSDMYSAHGNQLFFILIPFAYGLSIPVRVMLGTASLGSVMVLLGMSIIFFVGSHKFWKYALRFYTSANG